MAILDKKFEDDDFDLNFDTEEINDLVDEVDTLLTDDSIEELSENTETEINNSSVEEELSLDNDNIDLDETNEISEELSEDTFDTPSEELANNNSLSDGKTDERSKELKNYILYIITDKKHPNMLNYFRYYGSKVTKIFDNIADAKDVLLMQIEPCKVVVIDSGTGKFTGMSARKSLMDLLSISDEENRIAIFYTDSVIKSEAKNTDGVEDKDITWHKYKSTSGVLAVLLQNLSKENYVYDMKSEENVDRSEEVLNFQGATVKVKGNNNDLGLPILSVNDIIAHEGSNISAEESLKTYKVKI